MNVHPVADIDARRFAGLSADMNDLVSREAKPDTEPFIPVQGFVSKLVRFPD